MGLKQVIPGQNASNGNQAFFSIRGNDGNPSEGSVAFRVPVDVTFSHLTLHLNTAPGGSDFKAIELWVGGAGSGLKATCTGAAVDAADTTTSVFVPAGTFISIKRTGLSFAAANDASWTITAEADDDVTSFHGWSAWDIGPLDATTTKDFAVLEGQRGPEETSRGTRIPAPGTTTKLYIDLKDAPGSGKSRQFLVVLEGVAQNGSGGTVDTRITIANATTSGSATFSLPNAAGNRLQIREIPSGSPSPNTSFSGSIAWRASTPARYFLACESFTPSGTVVNYLAFSDNSGSAIGPSATESDVRLVGPIDQFNINTGYVDQATAPGSGKSCTYTLRKAGADPSGFSVTIADLATSGHDTGATVDYTTASDYISFKSSPSGTPAIGHVFFSLVFVDPTSVPPDPDVETRAATHLRKTAATLNGRVNPNGGSTVTAWFEWGACGSPLDLDESTTPQAIETGSEFVPFSARLLGLAPNTTYCFRAVASNAIDTFYGDVYSFTTINEPEFTDGTASHPLIMREFVDRQGTSYVAAEVQLNDPGPDTYGGTGYEHGEKEPRILEVGEITRGLSDYQGQLEHLAFSLREDDIDYFWRTILSEPRGGGSPISRAYLTNRPFILKIIDDEDRRQLKPWRVVANGYISDYSLLPNLQFTETGTDWLKKRFSRSFRAQYAWQRLITTEDFPNADATLTTLDGVQIPVAAVGKAVPVIYGKLSDAGVLDADPADTPVGVYKPIYVGDIVIDDETYRRGLICGHAAYLESAFLNDTEIDLETDPDWLTPRNATAWSAAGFSTDYQDINGRRYFEIYLKGDAGDTLAGITAPPLGAVGVTLNIWGVEDVGDNSGNVIEHPVLQMKHFVMNYLAPTTPYADGDWLTESPLFETLPALTLMDEDSFDLTAVIVNDRLASGEYVGAGVIGANGEAVAAEDALAWWKNSAYIEDYFTRTGQYGVTAEPPGPVGGEVSLDDVINIVEGSLSTPELVTSQFWTTIPFVHTRDFCGRRSSGWISTSAFDIARTYLTLRTTQTEAINDTGIANYETETKSQRFDLHFGWGYSAQGALTIVDSLIRRLLSYTDPRRKVQFTVPFEATSIEPGQVFKLTTLEGVGPTGWSNHYVRASRHITDVDKGQVRLEGYDIGQIWGFP